MLLDDIFVGEQWKKELGCKVGYSASYKKLWIYMVHIPTKKNSPNDLKHFWNAAAL